MRQIKRIIDLLEILVHPNGNYHFLKNKAKSISSFRIASRIYEYCNQLDTIIDVGANIGQFTSAMELFFPKANYYCFEPLPEAFNKLHNNLRGEKYSLYNYALGAKEDIIDFYQNNHSHASSALKISKLQEDSFPETKGYSIIKIKTKRLDSIVLNHEGVFLLKLDVQGFEKEVLIGATNILNKVDYILLELSFVPMYENEILFNEMYSYLKELNFKMVAPLGYLETNEGIIVQSDVLFKNNLI